MAQNGAEWPGGDDTIEAGRDFRPGERSEPPNDAPPQSDAQGVWSAALAAVLFAATVLILELR